MRRPAGSDPPKFLTPEEAAPCLGLSPAGVRAAIRRGEVAAVRFGRSWRVPLRVLQDLEDRAVAEGWERRQRAKQQAKVADENQTWTSGELKSLVRRPD